MYDAALCDITLKDSSLFASVSLSQSLTLITAVTAIILCVSSVQINTYDSNVIKICANVSHSDLKIETSATTRAGFFCFKIALAM